MSADQPSTAALPTGIQVVLHDLAEYKGKRVALRIFVDGVAGEMPKNPQVIYAKVKTSDLTHFLRCECQGVHPS